MNIKVRKLNTIDIQKELRKTEKHPLFNIVVPDTTTINLSGRKSIRTNKFNRNFNRIVEYTLGVLFFTGMMFMLFGTLFIIIGSYGKASAEGKTICKSEKCEARYNRIVTCQKYTKNENDVLQCALWKTVFTRKEGVDRHEKEVIKEELKNLMEKMEGTDTFFDKLKEFVKKGEGSFQEKAFCDSYYKTNKGLVRHPAHLCTRWSIGYGTISYQGEKITLEEGLKRKAEDLQKRNALITSDCLSDNQRIAVVDFMYQHGANSSGIVKKANSCDIKGIYSVFVNWRDVYKNKKQSGMVKREQMRINLFNND